ncbi:MAG: response regulator [Thermomonas sp.]
MRDQQFYTRSLIESNIDALMTTNPQGTITDVNEQMLALTGRARDELIGAPCRNFFTDPGLADVAIQRVLAEKKLSNYELTVRARDGKETVVSYNAATFYDREEQLQGVFAAARDVTERKRFDRTLQEKNIELEHASRMKSEFLSTMSHELRTPLNAINGFSEALRDGLMGPLSETQQEYIGDIFASGQHLLSLINDILDLSKVEAGMMTLELEPENLAALLNSSLSIVREKAAAQGISLALDLCDIPDTLQLDTRKTKQIVYNLLSNAVKFGAGGGSVTLRGCRVERDQVGTGEGDWPMHGFALADSEFGEFLEISVTDWGMGISRANMAKLFQPFTQIDSSLARKFEGSGLGLALVKQMAELHGGTVAVASCEGEGTRFVVWLPVRDQGALIYSEPTPNRTVRGPTLSAGPRHAMVVEDDELAAELVKLLLEAEGFTVVVAGSGEIALELLELHNLDLITLDLQLPGMSGLDLLHRLRSDIRTANVPAVIVSGQTDGRIGLSAGAAAVLQKPISRLQLQDSLESLGLQETLHKTHTVLVVDDDPKAVELIAAYLSPPSYAVVRAYGGNDAIELARKLIPDLILLDLMMPEVSGFDVVEALSRNPQTARIPILVLTAKQVTPLDLATLNRNPKNLIHIVKKAGFDRIGFMSEVRRALNVSEAGHGSNTGH